ncbi:MAG: DNA-processing protein DprA [Candidatus Caenarcaniphilales bacterium]|nr:DNA-processing protein DprA [Candidatus Caenarcaniphilales bacterium]
MTINIISGETEELLSVDELTNEFRLIQSGEKRISIIGTRNLSITHQQVVEAVASAMVNARNTVVTSGGASGVNFAAMRGAINSSPDLLEVVLPQTIDLQPHEVQEYIKKAKLVIEHPERKEMEFSEASRICYNEIIDTTHQLICFLYHDSRTLLRAVDYAKLNHKIVTVFYLD